MGQWNHLWTPVSFSWWTEESLVNKTVKPVNRAPPPSAMALCHNGSLEVTRCVSGHLQFIHSPSTAWISLWLIKERKWTLRRILSLFFMIVIHDLFDIVHCATHASPRRVPRSVCLWTLWLKSIRTQFHSVRADGWEEVAGIQELGVHACY